MASDDQAKEQAEFATLPTHAQERLADMRGTGEDRRLFTSDLSVSEFLLVKEAGFDPVGLVIGSSIYHVGYQRAQWSQNQEMSVLTQAMYQARELAMTRMEEEAEALGADTSPSSWRSAPPCCTVASPAVSATSTTGPSPPTSPARTSTCCSAPGTARSAW